MPLTAIEKIEKEVEELTINDKLDLLENIVIQLKSSGLQDRIKILQNKSKINIGQKPDLSRYRGIYKGRDLNLTKESNDMRNEWERNT